jgi:signal transduction histidine kinase/DNA-binding response OmpR family regulator/HAMP domain-containing protein
MGRGVATQLKQALSDLADGDFSTRIVLSDFDGDKDVARLVNKIASRNEMLMRQLERLAKVVGKEGKIDQRGEMKDAEGDWLSVMDSVNNLIEDTVQPTAEVSRVIGAVAKGDLSQHMSTEIDGRPLRGEFLRIGKVVNRMVDQLDSFADEVTRVAREVGTEGKLGGQARVRGVAGTWKDLTDNVNAMAGNLTGQVRNIAEVTTAVARGDLSKKITVDVKGEIAELKDTINTMVDQLNSFASEVTRVAREVGTEGKLGGQAKVEGVVGAWKDLTDNVNLMADNLTDQVRGIADVVTAVAQGNLKRKLTLDAKGEIASLAETINFMIDTLSTFGDQVTSMAREVGIEGRLGGQASVPGAAGLWRDLTDNVNQLAANLTNQVRSIAEVATAVTKGDLTRSIAVQASGEMAALKDNINEMIRNLKEQTLKNAEQDWLKTNLARFSRMLQGERELATVCSLIMTELAPLVNAQHGAFYVTRTDGDQAELELAASYGVPRLDDMPASFKFGEGLIGQCAADKRPIWLENVPARFIQIGSGLVSAPPASVLIMPALFENEVKAVIELASFGEFSETHRNFLDQFMESVGVVLNTIAATMRTEGLLEKSQLLTHELQSRQTELTTKQEELGRTNEELQEKAQLLEYEKKQVEAKNLEIDMARRAIEEKAEQLALTSKYKSEFLANMSHELRTPLNSLLILSKLLSENQQGNLTEKQIEFARTIHSAGADLLNLINDILDLSKIESGTVTIDVTDVPLDGLKVYVERHFRQVAANKNLNFTVELDSSLPATIRTDEKRLQQIVLNLLSNAFKFTSQGSVTMKIDRVASGWSPGHAVLDRQKEAVGISVTDTGIGIPREKQKLIFEAFQQADGTTSREYGGTGLGLSISREIVGLLGGQLRVQSQPGQGSTFSLFVPLHIEPVEYAGEASEDDGPAADIVARSTVERDAAPIAMIVTDDDDIAARAVASARSAGFEGIVCATGAGAARMAERLSPKFISLDLGIDEMHGEVLLEFLRTHEVTCGLPLHVMAPPQAAVPDADVTVARDAKPAEFTKSYQKTAKLLGHRSAKATTLADPKAGQGLAGKHVLIIDDDIRNIYSLTSALESEGVRVSFAERGRAGIEILRSHRDIDVALIDIMMPEMDGYETMREISRDDRIATIPMIAVTAKAMKGDRAKCLAAGATDYIAKPVDIDLLLAMLRVWTRGPAAPGRKRVPAELDAAE